jgi:predicted Zn-dependent peptidase
MHARRIIVGLVVLAAVQAAWAGEVLQLDVQEFTIENGLTILVVERHQVPTVAVSLTYRVGSADEWTGITGTAHFVEHLYTKGTPMLGTTDWPLEQKLIAETDEVMEALRAERRRATPDEEKVKALEARYAELKAQHDAITDTSAIDKLLTEAGAADRNASTSYDRTNYYMSLPANTFELWCSIFSQIMRGPVFRGFYEEQQVVIEERYMRVSNSPGGALWEALMATAYSAHPYHHPLLGWPDDMASYTRAQVKAFYTRYYAPNQAVISVVGDITAKDAVALIERYFGDIPRQPAPSTRHTREPEPRGEKIVTVDYDAQPVVYSAWLTVPLADDDFPVFDVIAEILTGGRTTRLYKRLVEEEQIAAGVGTWMMDLRDRNLFMYGAAPRAPHTVQEIDAAVLEEIERLKTEPVDEHELERAKNQLAADFVRRLESNIELAKQLGEYEVVIGWEYMRDVVERTEAVTADDIQRVAREHLNRTNRTLAYIVQKTAPAAASPSGATAPQAE